MDSLREVRDSLPLNSIQSLFILLVIPLVLFLHRCLSTPSKEHPGSFKWSVPPEASSAWIPSHSIKNPSIHSHLTDSSLLPPATSASASSKFITCYAPASGGHLSTIPSATDTSIYESISRAELAQKKWKESSWAERRKVMNTLLVWCVQDMEGIARIASRDTGKTMVDAAFGEILVTAEKLRWVIANGEGILKPESRRTNLLLAHKVHKVVYEPLGVVCAIVSWNYPFHNLISPIIASLFSGNAIVVKPSENVAWSSHHYVDAIKACLIACNQDPELVQIVTCLPDSVEALTGDPRIKHITFIGSEEVGKKVAIKGAQVGTPVLLELGGKDPCIITSSADVKFFCATWLRGAFQAAGQNCIGIERFIVSSALYSTFVSTMDLQIGKLTVGDILSPTSSSSKPPDVGALVTDVRFPHLERLIQSAVSQGARLLHGGHQFHHPSFQNGHYFSPTLLVDVTSDMDIAKDELFAPVMLVMKFDTKEEAIELANGTRYGLGASVFGRDRTECRWISDRVVAGMVSINDFGVFYLNQALPFGGTKSSGHGRFAGREGLRGLCNPKAITEDRFHGVIQTGIPPLLAYPICSGDAAWRFVSGLVGVVYGGGVGVKARALWRLATAGRNA